MNEQVAGDREGGGLAISARHLGKAYASFASPVKRLGAVLFGRGLPAESFWALRDLSLDVPKGESLGVIGQNGAGKSTLLQLLCSTLAPTTGTLQVQGRIAALLELGAGFNPDFSGRDNLLLNGPLLGLTRAQLEERLEDIIDFSGVRAFIDQPVKTYSSGMFVRLAFSLATSVDPDILVIDEALSVGDGEFARKSFDRILAMKERGTTILFCSHSLYQVEAFCTRVIWLHQGQVRAIGEPHDVVRDYTMFLAAQADAAGGTAGPGPGQAITQTPGHGWCSRTRKWTRATPSRTGRSRYRSHPSTAPTSNISNRPTPACDARTRGSPARTSVATTPAPRRSRGGSSRPRTGSPS